MNKIRNTLDHPREAAAKRSNTVTTLPPRTCAVETRSASGNPETACKVLGIAAAVSDTRAFTLFLELMMEDCNERTLP